MHRVVFQERWWQQQEQLIGLNWNSDMYLEAMGIIGGTGRLTGIVDSLGSEWLIEL